jgi:hypothetical protein
MKLLFRMAVLLVASVPLALSAGVQQDPHRENHQDKRLEGVNERGDHAMGFSHEKTTHHFQLTVEGGSIEVTANDPKDATSLTQIRAHLAHIAKLFKAGDFSMPMFTHAEQPPGVSVMTRLKEEITYTFEPIERGGRVRITSSNTEALDAVHDFLRYQIKDHKTGDPLEVKVP